MLRFDSDTGFPADQRAVSPVIGFILLFALLVMSLTMYQAQIVPEQNAQVEFQHSQEVQNDMTKLRNDISMAGLTDSSKFTRVTLGTTYQMRLMSINPVAPAGTLRTSDEYNITIENETVSKKVSTRFLQYESRYNEIRADSIWYEHSVVYTDEGDEGAVRILEDQNLMTNDSNTLRLVAIQNEFEETDTQKETIRFYPSENSDESTLPNGELNVTIPTRLNKSEYWEAQLGDDVDVEEDYHDPGVHRLELSDLDVNSSDVRFNTVGIRGRPGTNKTKQNVGASR